VEDERPPTRLALVGLGDIAVTAHLPALLRSPAVDLVAGVDPLEERRRTIVDVPTYSRTEELPGPVDGYVLATPPWVTTELAAGLLRQGRFVLAEKPIATSVAAAAPLTALPRAETARLQAGLTYRHDPALARLRDWIRQGPLDGPLLVRAHVYDERFDPADPEHAARIRRTLEHGPPVMHEGSHVFDWLAYLLDGAPATVADAWAVSTNGRTNGRPNLIGARLSYPGDTTALCEFGWLTDQLPRCGLSFLAQHGYAVLDGFTFRLTLHINAGVEVFDQPADRTTRCFDRQLDRFVALVRGESERAVPGLAEALAALELSERVVRIAAQEDRS
jgi:myo-inositol 2-dehydrogenase / D-chiro-inositol 1-dehydrogenase